MQSPESRLARSTDSGGIRLAVVGMGGIGRERAIHSITHLRHTGEIA